MRRRWLISVVLMLIGPANAWAQSWPAKPIKGDCALYRRRRHRHRLAHRCATIVSPARPAHHHRDPARAPAAPSAQMPSRRRTRTATPSCSRLRATPSRRGSMPTCPTTRRAISRRSRRSPTLPNVLVIAPEKNIKTVQELVAAARAKPGAMTYASAGAGSATHLNAQRFLLSAGVTAVHIPFKGGPEALREVITGRVDFYFAPLLIALPFIQAGQVRALAVSNATRVAALPDVPTTTEAGFPNSDYNFWVAMFVPSKTPREIVDKLYQETANGSATAGNEGQARQARRRADDDETRGVRRLCEERDRDQCGARQSRRARDAMTIRPERRCDIQDGGENLCRQPHIKRHSPS